MNEPDIPIAFDDLGSGPAVVLLHPAGFGPELLGPFAESLAADHRVIVPHRRGYGRSAARPVPVDLDRTHDDLAEVLRGAGVRSAAIVGLSAGATLALGFARRHPDLTGWTLAHEPLIGPAGGPLHDQVAARIRRLLERPDEHFEASLFMSGLVGIPTWNRLREDWRRNVERYQEIVRYEAALFAGLHWSSSDLARIGPRSTATVGGRSGEPRFELAGVLDDLGFDVRVVPECAHLPSTEVPSLWRALVAECAGRASLDVATRDVAAAALVGTPANGSREQP